MPRKAKVIGPAPPPLFKAPKKKKSSLKGFLGPIASGIQSFTSSNFGKIALAAGAVAGTYYLIQKHDTRKPDEEVGVFGRTVDSVRKGYKETKERTVAAVQDASKEVGGVLASAEELTQKGLDYFGPGAKIIGKFVIPEEKQALVTEFANHYFPKETVAEESKLPEPGVDLNQVYAYGQEQGVLEAVNNGWVVPRDEAEAVLQNTVNNVLMQKAKEESLRSNLRGYFNNALSHVRAKKINQAYNQGRSDIFNSDALVPRDVADQVLSTSNAQAYMKGAQDTQTDLLSTGKLIDRSMAEAVLNDQKYQAFEAGKQMGRYKQAVAQVAQKKIQKAVTGTINKNKETKKAAQTKRQDVKNSLQKRYADVIKSKEEVKETALVAGTKKRKMK